jgi:alpha-ketoglutarate-dependent taurine dioxygenase
LPFGIVPLTYRVVPEIGGRTLRADAQAACHDLSEPVRRLLKSVIAVYDALHGDGTYDDRTRVTVTVEQPVVGAHRHTGCTGLLISTGAIRLNGVTS